MNKKTTLTDDYPTKLNTLSKILSEFRTAGLSLTNEPHTSRDFKRIEIVNETIPDIDPRKAAKGIVSQTIKKLYLYDKTLDGVLDTLKKYSIIQQDPRVHIPNGPAAIEVVTKSNYQYARITESGLFYIPVDSSSKVTEPVFVILNFDKSVIDPGDIGPAVKYLPVSRLGNIQTIALFSTVWWLFVNLDMYELLAFLVQTDSTAGRTILLNMIKDTSTLKAIFEKSFNTVINLMHTFSALKWLGNIIRRQVNMNTSYQTILEVLQDSEKLEKYLEMKSEYIALEKVKEVCKLHAPKFENKITALEYTIFLKRKQRVTTDTLRVGPITNVTHRKITMSSDGAYVTSSYEVKPELTEKLLKSVRYFKQKVRSNNFFRPPDNMDRYDNIVTVRIPTANWDCANSIESDFSGAEGFKIVQDTRNSTIFSQDASAIFSTLRDHFTDGSTIGASVSWDAVSGKGSLKVTKLYKEEVF